MLIEGELVEFEARQPRQVSSQIDEPDFGTLFDEMLYESGQPIPASRFIRPRVEVELAFLLSKLTLLSFSLGLLLCRLRPLLRLGSSLLLS